MTRAKFVVFVRAAKLGVVAAVDAEGHPEAALVDLAVTDHGEVPFDTMAGARKVVSIGGNQRVALVVGWADTVFGTGRGALGCRAREVRSHSPGAGPEVPRVTRGLHAGQDDSDVVALLRRARPESFSIVETPLL